MRQTTMAKPNEIARQWYVVDGAGCTLGRLASEVASVLRGKHKPIYTPNVDCGDYVIVINADKIVITGEQKELLQPFSVPRRTACADNSGYERTVHGRMG